MGLLVRIKGAVFGLMVGWLIAGCDVKNEPIPFTDSPLVGVWEGQRKVHKEGVMQIQHMYLEFTEAGYMALHHVNCWADSDKEPVVWRVKDFQIDFMPVIKINQKKVKAQWMPFSPKIELMLDEWPKEVQGKVIMQADGMLLEAKPVASDRSQWVCELMAKQ